MPPNRRLRTGRIPEDVLRRCVLNHLGTPSDRVIRGAAIGEDASVIDMGNKVLVAKANPITGAEGNIGRLAVHINANDVATRGAKPLWFMDTIFLPEETNENRLYEIMDEIHTACCELGVQLIGGHTESIRGLDKPIISGFMLGEAKKEKYITTEGAKSDDEIILTKTAGLEGTSILATDLEEKLKRKVDQKTLQRARRMIDKISVVPEALKAVDVGGVHALHTPTEGGVLNGLYEMATAAGIGLRVDEARIPIAPETAVIVETLGVDPLKLLSSGALLMSVDKGYTERILDALEKIHIKASLIGEATVKEEGRIITRNNGTQKKIESVGRDELFRILGDE